MNIIYLALVNFDCLLFVSRLLLFYEKCILWEIEYLIKTNKHKQNPKPNQINSVSFPVHKNVELITQHYSVFFDKVFNVAI